MPPAPLHGGGSKLWPEPPRKHLEHDLPRAGDRPAPDPSTTPDQRQTCATLHLKSQRPAACLSGQRTQGPTSKIAGWWIAVGRYPAMNSPISSGGYSLHSYRGPRQAYLACKAGRSTGNRFAAITTNHGIGTTSSSTPPGRSPKSPSPRCSTVSVTHRRTAHVRAPKTQRLCIAAARRPKGEGPPVGGRGRQPALAGSSARARVGARRYESVPVSMAVPSAYEAPSRTWRSRCANSSGFPAYPNSPSMNPP